MNDRIQIVEKEPLASHISCSVDALLTRMEAAANIDIWGRDGFTTHVQGTVGKVKPHKEVVFFELKGDRGKIDVKCPREFAPCEGEKIMVQGTPLFRLSPFVAGLGVQIEGRPTAQWQSMQKVNAEQSLNLHKASYVKIEHFLRHNAVESLQILGTDTALRDVLSQIGVDIDLQVGTIRVSDKRTLLEDIQSSISTCEAFAIVRGGDDDSLYIWDDREVIEMLLSYQKPFYIALGHTHFIPLTVQYADESFATPTAFGTVIREILSNNIRQEKTRQEIARLRYRLNEQQAESRTREQELEQRIDQLSLKYTQRISSVMASHTSAMRRYEVIIVLFAVMLLASIFLK